MNRIIFLTVLCALHGIGIRAQEPKEVNIKTLPARFLSNEKDIWLSPIRPSSYSSHAVKKYVIPFAAISLALIATDRKTAGGLPNTLDQSRWSGRVSQIGSWYTLGGIGGASYLAGRFAGDDHAKEAGLLSLEALGHAQVAAFALKQATNRERPTEHEGRGGFWRGGTSFPSGHAASAFAVATVFAYEYRENIAVPITSYSLASLVAVSRAGARRHWASDIFAGSALGFMVGRFTYRRNHNPELPGSKVNRAARMVPRFSYTQNGPGLSWEF
ncbi:MAG: phosphatase PAP2 family protein [Acidobacteria bacterium]|nr:phosphatase PAP2 family protein [Acidobacteriota bacterium]